MAGASGWLPDHSLADWGVMVVDHRNPVSIARGKDADSQSSV
jgi:hypothetical protein